jgi:HPt (histidine-containing phosphotransfer) domain-containing protein
MDDFLTKPFQVETLVRVIREHLHRSGFMGRDSRPESLLPESSGGVSTASGVPEYATESVRNGGDAPPAEASAEGVQAGVFEPQHMVAMLGAGEGSEALVRKLVGQFLELTPSTLESGREAIEKGLDQEAIRAYHNLKSTSASLGALALSAAARRMEELLSESGLSGHDEPRQVVEREFERVEILARQWLAS